MDKSEEELPQPRKRLAGDVGDAGAEESDAEGKKASGHLSGSRGASPEDSDLIVLTGASGTAKKTEKRRLTGAEETRPLRVKL